MRIIWQMLDYTLDKDPTFHCTIGGIMSRILMPASPRWSRPWDWWPCWPWRYVDPVVSVDHADSVDHVNSGDYVDHNDHVDHVDHVDYVNYQVDSINHIDHALNFPATANMQREEKKGKERSIYSGELVFEIKNDFVFPCVIKSFHFPCSNWLVKWIRFLRKGHGWQKI